MTALLICLLAGSLMGPRALTGQALSAPDGWRTSAERFVEMAPGFHITTSGSVLLYHPEARALGEFTLASEGFLFSGESAETYGVFIGGRDLDSDAAVWTSLEVGHDGAWVVRHRADGVVSDMAGPEVGAVAVPGDEPTAKNSLSVIATGSNVAFLVNGATVVELPREGLAVEGVTGFRVGADLNLHLTTFDITIGDSTRQLAPAREEAADS
jgi:hypothetical protein